MIRKKLPCGDYGLLNVRQTNPDKGHGWKDVFEEQKEGKCGRCTVCKRGVEKEEVQEAAVRMGPG